MDLFLVKRRFYGVYHNSLGQPEGGKEIVLEALRDVGADRILAPNEPVTVVTSNQPGHVGEYDFELYTVEDSFIKYRVMLPNGKTPVIDVAPGGATSLDAAINFASLPDELPSWFELNAEMSATASQAIIAHVDEDDPHSQYLTETESDARHYTKTQSNTNNNAARDAAISTVRAGVATRGDNLAKLLALIDSATAIIGGSTPDGDDIVNRVQELYTIFQGFSEQVDLATLLNDLNAILESQTANFESYDSNRNVNLGDGGRFAVKDRDGSELFSLENGTPVFYRPDVGTSVQFLGYQAGSGLPTADQFNFGHDVGYAFYTDADAGNKYLVFYNALYTEPYFEYIKVRQPIEKRLSSDINYDSVQYLEIADFTFNLLPNRRYRVESCLRIFASNNDTTVRLKFDNRETTSLEHESLRAEITGGSDLFNLADFFSPVDAAFTNSGAEKLIKHIGEIIFSGTAEIGVSFAPKVDGREFTLRAGSWIRFTDITS